MNKQTLMMVIVAILAVTFIGLWAIDISVSALLCGARLYNGFYFANPAVVYHTALYLIIFLQMLNIGLWILILVENKKISP